MIIDFHTHAFADKIAEAAMRSLHKSAGLRPYTDGTVSGLRASMQENGIDISVVLPIATKPEQQRIINDWAAFIRAADIIPFGSVHPMEAKKNLAEEIITRFHSAAEARQARENFERVFSRRENPEDMTEYKYQKGTALMDIILGLEFSPSRNEAKRLCQQGGVYLDGEKVSDLMVTPAGEAVLRVGKRKFAKISER